MENGDKVGRDLDMQGPRRSKKREEFYYSRGRERKVAEVAWTLVIWVEIQSEGDNFQSCFRVRSENGFWCAGLMDWLVVDVRLERFLSSAKAGAFGWRSPRVRMLCI